jgi:hypothetical protein
MSTVAASSQPSWLSSYDPSDPSTLTGLLATSVNDPANRSTPAGFDVLQPTAAVANPASTPANQFQQALASLTQQADTYLIQSALGGSQQPAAAAAFGSTQAYYQGLNSTAQQILSAGQSGNYGSLDALA